MSNMYIAFLLLLSINAVHCQGWLRWLSSPYAFQSCPTQCRIAQNGYPCHSHLQFATNPYTGCDMQPCRCVPKPAPYNYRTFPRNRNNFVESVTKLIPSISDKLFSRTKSGIAVVEGDILVDRQSEWRVREMYLKNQRGLMPSTSTRYWPTEEIPYKLDSSLDAFMLTAIETAIAGFTQRTCIRFIPRTTETDYIEIASNEANGCSSYVGRNGNKQRIYLENGRCTSIGTIQHEFMHTLGFYHEHSRSDRDSYVTINYTNIDTSFSRNFMKHTTEDFQSTYDFYSTMHYPLTAFAIDREINTINIKNPAGVDISRVGQRVGMSETDSYQINRVYCAGSPTTAASTSTTAAPSTCENIRDTVKCEKHKREGYCESGDKSTPRKCKKTCGLCDQQPPQCKNLRKTSRCETHRSKGFCTSGKRDTPAQCQMTCGFCNEGTQASNPHINFNAPAAKDFDSVRCEIIKKKKNCRHIKYKNYAKQYCEKSCPRN